MISSSTCSQVAALVPCSFLRWRRLIRNKVYFVAAMNSLKRFVAVSSFCQNISGCH